MARCDWRFEEFAVQGMTDAEIEALPRCPQDVVDGQHYCAEHEEVLNRPTFGDVAFVHERQPEPPKTTTETEYSIWNVWTGGSEIHADDKWIFDEPFYVSKDLRDLKRYKADLDSMDQDRYPLGNGDRRYRSTTVIKERTVTYGEWH